MLMCHVKLAAFLGPSPYDSPAEARRNACQLSYDKGIKYRLSLDPTAPLMRFTVDQFLGDADAVRRQNPHVAAAAQVAPIGPPPESEVHAPPTMDHTAVNTHAAVKHAFSESELKFESIEKFMMKYFDRFPLLSILSGVCRLIMGLAQVVCYGLHGIFHEMKAMCVSEGIEESHAYSKHKFTLVKHGALNIVKGCLSPILFPLNYYHDSNGIRFSYPNEKKAAQVS